MVIYGIDLAKEKFDVNFISKNGEPKYFIVENKFSKIMRFLVRLPEEVVLVAEHTGIYGNLLVFLCNQLDIPICLVSGYTIKHSQGLLKGKSDKLDSARIREYGERFFDKLEATEYESETLSELHELYTLRAQLVNKRKSIETHHREKKVKPYCSISAYNKTQKVILQLKTTIKEIEKELVQIIESEPVLKTTYELASSIMGIGPVTACDLIIKTGNFEKINTAKKAASYAGVCPFPNSTGKKVKKDRTSHMSDKSLKSLLHMCSMSALQYNQVYRLYYMKKQLEGKSHYLIMNNICNKLLRTVYSVIQSGKPYDRNYICLDPREKKKITA